MPPLRRIRRRGPVLLLALALVALAGVAPALAAPIVTIDPVPGEPELRPPAGPLNLVVSGDADPDTEIILKTDNVVTSELTQVCGPVIAGLDGRWTCTIAEVDDYAGHLRAYVGVNAMYSAPLSIIGAPTLSVPGPGVDDTPTIAGTVPAGGVSSQVTVTVDGTIACTAVVAPGSAWSCDVAAGTLTTDGTYTIGAFQLKDLGGGQSGTSATTWGTYVYDTTGPGTAATFTTPATSPTTITTTTLALAGTAEAHGSVTVLAGATPVCGPVTVDGAGVWGCTATLPGPGTHTLSIEQRDALGHLATVPSATVVVTSTAAIVVTPPTTNIAPPVVVAPPTILIEAPASTAIEIPEVPPTAVSYFRDLNARIHTTELVVESFESFCNLVTGGAGGCSGGVFAETRTVFPPITLPPGYQFHFGDCPPNATQELCADYREVKIDLYIRSEPILLASAILDYANPTTLTAELPAEVAPGEHHLELVLSHADDPDAESLSVSIPITVVDAVSDEQPFPWWAWLLLAVAVLAAAVVVVVLVRRARA